MGIYSKYNILEKTPQTLALEVIFAIKGQKKNNYQWGKFYKG